MTLDVISSVSSSAVMTEEQGQSKLRSEKVVGTSKARQQHDDKLEAMQRMQLLKLHGYGYHSLRHAHAKKLR
jgi:hypothetical protein